MNRTRPLLRSNSKVKMQLIEERLRNLMLRSLAGDASSYHLFLDQLAVHLRSFLRKRLARLPEEAEDLVQELLWAIHNQRHTYDAKLPLTAWVHAIARYKLIDLLRRRSRIDMLNDSLDEAGELFAAPDREAAEAGYDIAKLLDQLPDRQRLPIQYVKIEGASVADAAARTGMSVSAVKVGIHRGLKTLAAKIRNNG
ncbi:MAG: sigma-70 family RNA polymerase sigma factor [Steroidobacteraceae bacterium]